MRRSPRKSRLSRRLRIIFTAGLVSFYAVVAPFGYAAFALWSLVPTRQPARRKAFFQVVLNRAFRSMHTVIRWLRVLDFDPRDIEGEIPAGPCVLVANHPTLTDISGLLAAIRPLAFPVKPNLYHQFWARPLLKMAGAFEGPGNKTFGAARFVDLAVARLEQGERIIVFPEGTRSRGPLPDAFGRAPFEIAVRADVPVVPVCIHITPHWLSKQSRILDPPEQTPKLTLRILAPIAPDEAGSSSRKLRDIVHDQIHSEISRLEKQASAHL